MELDKTGGLTEGLTKALSGISINDLTGTVSLDQHGDGVRIIY